MMRQRLKTTTMKMLQTLFSNQLSTQEKLQTLEELGMADE